MILKNKSSKALKGFFSALFLSISIFVFPAQIYAQSSIRVDSNLVLAPELTQRVVDLTNTLTADQIELIENKLVHFEKLKGSQIAVLIVDTTYPEDISQYSIRVVEKWKLGRAKVDDGVLLLIAKKDRRIRIEVGYGLEGVLTDATAKRIISEIISPQFKQGRFFDGINDGIDNLIALISQEKLPENSSQSQQVDQNGVLLIAFIFALFVGSVLRSIFGSGLGGLITGAVVGGLAWFISQLVGISILAGFIGFIATFVGNVGGPLIWGGGGGGSGFSGSRGQDGPFSGGGGGFGGGGASGDW